MRTGIEMQLNENTISLFYSNSPKVKFALDIAKILTILFFVGGSNGTQAASVPSENDVKAVFLFNLVKFVEWPTHTFIKADSPIAICILGNDPFGDILDQTVKGEKIGGRELVIRRSGKLGELKTCHLIFVSDSEKASMVEIIRSLSSERVLTVSDIEEFGRAGGMIEFYLEKKRLRFKINQTAAERAGLKLNAQLLALGKAVQ